MLRLVSGNNTSPGPSIALNIQQTPVKLNVQQPPTSQQTPISLNIQQKQVNLNLLPQSAKPLVLNTGVTNPIKLNTEGQMLTMKTGTSPNANYGGEFGGASQYVEYDHRTHVYMKPDTYIGADEKMVREEWIYNAETGMMVNASIDFVPGAERLYLEILTNASDNVGKSRRAGIDPGQIVIIMNNSTISITNYGIPIPVEIHPVQKVYAPQMIFGSLLTSSHFVEDRHEAGTNGIGAKAANIFSEEFMAIIHDHIRRLKYTQVWNENMTRRSEPIIEPYTGAVSSVQVVYKMDFARFGYSKPNGNEGGYPAEAFALFARHAIDISFTSKTTVTFNGQVFNYANIRDYARLYFGTAVDTAIVHYQWPEGTEVVTKKKGYQVAKNGTTTPEIELIAIDTPDNGHHVSFVNCMMTRDGGVHVNAAVKAVGDSAVKTINDGVLKKLTRQNKGKELDAKDKRAHTISINDVKPHISILLSAKVTNPKFTSQTKTVLHSPVPKIVVPEEELRGINRWQLIARLYAAIEAKQFMSMSKTDGKLRKYLSLPKGIDANFAGKAQRHQCGLYCSEGRSGAGYGNKLIGLIPGGRDYIGVLPMRGKPFNVMDKQLFQIEKNAEIVELKTMLGLREGLDYSEPANFSKLRYGYLLIMADSDVDGKHIIGLILNFFHCRFPSLLALNFVKFYRTPILRAFFGHTTCKFYTQREYDLWQVNTSNYKSWRHKYYKGLGSSKDSEIKDDFLTPRVVTCAYDADAPASIRLAFDKKLADSRKDWMGRWQPVTGVDDIATQPISWFINYEMILFSIADTKRSIPKLTDGLKESLRKILHGAHLKWKIGSKKAYSEVKVAQFGAFVAEKSNYQHGESILDDVIVGMAQDFTGSNNVPWFSKDGQFGCVDPNTPIILWDGTIKLAKHITTDDVLIGDDGVERHVSKVVSGTDHMYTVTQSYGDSYTVNSKHILTLHFPEHKIVSWRDSTQEWYMEYFDDTTKSIKSKTIGTSGSIKSKTIGTSGSARLSKEDARIQIDLFAETILDTNIFDIEIGAYLSWSTYLQSLVTSVRNLCPIKWEKKEVPIDPYIFGTLIDDNRTVSADILRQHGFHGIKRIPDIYMINDEETRLQLLAGLIDTNGCLKFQDDVNAQVFEISNENFIDSIEYIAKSLGFKTTISIDDDKRIGLIINGDIYRIPTMLPKNRATKTSMIKDMIGEGISIQYSGIDEYVGWYLDGNERFLFGDFTVGHNTRFQGGKDAAETRYSHTRPDKLVSYIIRKEDRAILKYVIDEGEDVEPETYYPIVPMILVNGCHGIGTGYSTFIPNHNLLTILSWLILKLQGVDDKDLPDVYPWYKDFHGIIKVIDRRSRKKRNNKVNITIINNETGDATAAPIVNNVELEDDVDEFEGEEGLNDKENEVISEVEGSRPLLSMVTFGKFHIELGGTVVVTELPIGRWPYNYHKWLEGLVETKKITGFRDLSVDNTVYFEIYGFTDTPNYRTLKLKRTKGMSNMVLLDENSRPVRYDTAFDILESFYLRRLPIYQLRKDYILGRLTREIEVLNHKIRFIQALIRKEIRIINRKKADIYEGLDRLNIPRDIYDRSMNHHLSEDDITALTNQIAIKTQEHTELELITPKQMWLRELSELENIYRLHYNLKKPDITLPIGPQPKTPFPGIHLNSRSKPGVLNSNQQVRKQATPILMNIVPKLSVQENTTQQPPAQQSLQIMQQNPAQQSLQIMQQNPAQQSLQIMQQNPAQQSLQIMRQNPVQQSLQIMQQNPAVTPMSLNIAAPINSLNIMI